MNDKNQDDNDFNEDFQDDFEFEEEQFAEQPTTSASGPSPLQANRKIFLVFGVVIAFIAGYLIWYIFFKPNTVPPPGQAAENILIPAATAPNTVQPVLPPGGVPKAETQTPPAKPANEENLFSDTELQAFTEQPPVQPGLPVLPADQSITTDTVVTPNGGRPEVGPTSPTQEISPSKPIIVSTPPAPPVSETLPAAGELPKETTIQQLQQELFTPEKQIIVPSTPPGSPTQEIKPSVKLPEKPGEKTKEITVPISGPELQQFQQAVNAVTKLNQQMENNLNQIKYLDAYTREISQTVNKLNSQISAMDNRILALSNTATTLSKDVGTVKTEVGSVRRALGEETVSVDIMPSAPLARKQRVEVPLIEELDYTVHAVIPGRAWLKSSKGQIITVTEGDSIGNYGKVLVIDASNGVVLTNSGITFR